MDPRVHFDKVAESKPYASYHTTPTHSVTGYTPLATKAGKIMLKTSQMHSTASQEAVYNIRPQSSISGSLTGSQEIVVELVGHCQIYDENFIEITLVNNSGAAVNPGYIGNMFDRIEIRTGRGDVVMFKRPEELLLDNINLSDEDFESMAPVMGLTGDFQVNGGASNNIAAGARRTYYLPLRSFLTTSGICVDALKDKLYVHLYLKPIEPVTGAAADFTLDDLQFVVLGRRISQRELKKLMSLYNSKTGVAHRYKYPIRDERDITLSPSTAYDLKLDSFHQLTTDLIIGLRANPRTAATFATFLPLESVNLKMKDGTNYDVPRSASFTKNILAPRYYKSSMTKDLELYPITFARHPSLFEKEGIMSGYFLFDSEERVEIRTPSTLVAGNYRLGVYGSACALFCIKEGRIVIKRT